MTSFPNKVLSLFHYFTHDQSLELQSRRKRSFVSSGVFYENVLKGNNISIIICIQHLNGTSFLADININVTKSKKIPAFTFMLKLTFGCNETKTS